MVFSGTLKVVLCRTTTLLATNRCLNNKTISREMFFKWHAAMVFQTFDTILIKFAISNEERHEQMKSNL